MKTEKNIMIAFILNLCFSIFELIGGFITGSIAILSDALHDVGDAASIGVSFFLEKKSKKKPDRANTYGYGRYSVLGGAVTTLILLIGSVAVIIGAINRLISPVEIDYGAMTVFAVVGVSVNLLAAFFTREGDSVNQRAVNLHMLEDVLGWSLVLVGAIVMKFTNFSILDPIISIGVAIFILISAIRNLSEIVGILLEKTPQDISISEIEEHLCEIEGVTSVHHIHVWSLDGQYNLATVHAVTDFEPSDIKAAIRNELHRHKIAHATIELESSSENCNDTVCCPELHIEKGHTHSHHRHAHAHRHHPH